MSLCVFSVSPQFELISDVQKLIEAHLSVILFAT